MVNSRVSNNATACGSFVSSARCNGQTMATMKMAKAKGAKMDLAKYSAAARRIVVQIASMALVWRSVSIGIDRSSERPEDRTQDDDGGKRKQGADDRHQENILVAAAVGHAADCEQRHDRAVMRQAVERAGDHHGNAVEQSGVDAMLGRKPEAPTGGDVGGFEQALRHGNEDEKGDEQADTAIGDDGAGKSHGTEPPRRSELLGHFDRAAVVHQLAEQGTEQKERKELREELRGSAHEGLGPMGKERLAGRGRSNKCGRRRQ